MGKKILLVTTLPSEVSSTPPAAGTEISIFDFSARPLDKRAFISWLDNYIASNHIDTLITYRCPYIIPGRITDRLQECVNIHPLALPRFAGLNPWEKFLASGENTSEAVIHRMEHIADQGEIIMRESFSFTSFSEARHNSDCAAAHLLEKYYKRIADL